MVADALLTCGSGERVRYAIETDDFDVVQLTLNVFEQNAIDDLLPLTQERDIGVLTKRPIGNAVWRFPARPGRGLGHGAAFCNQYSRRAFGNRGH